MSREGRIVFLGFLVPIIFATIIYVEKGGFILPYPLNEFIFLIVSIQFAFWNKENPWINIMLIFFSISNLLSNQLFWTFFLNDERMLFLSENSTFDFLKILSYFSLLVWGLFYLLSSEMKLKILFTLIFAGFIISAAIFNSSIILLSGLVLTTFTVCYKQMTPPYHLLWVLLTGLEGMKVLMLLI